MIIAFCGSTDSGKSTLIKEVRRFPYFAGKDLSIHRGDNLLIIKMLKMILGKKLFSNYNKQKLSTGVSDKKGIFSFLVHYFYPLAVYFEYLYLFIYFEVLFPNKILISDRFIYDYLVTFNYVLNIDNIFTKFVLNNFPRPELLFYLDIDAKTAIFRNKNAKKFLITTKLGFQEKMIKGYRKIAKIKNMLMLNTKQNIAEPVKKIKEYIFDRDKLIRNKEILICGVDGSGKSTVCNMLENYCNSLNAPSKVVHFYYGNMLFKFLRKIKLKKKGNIINYKERRMKIKKKLNRSSVLKFLLAFLHFTDSYLQIIFFRILYKNSVLIFDRYLYDYLVSFQYNKLFSWQLFEKLIPRVDNSFLLNGNPRVAFNRKPEAPLEFYYLSSFAYLNIAKKEEFNVIEIDGKNPKMIMNEIIRKLKK